MTTTKGIGRIIKNTISRGVTYTYRWWDKGQYEQTFSTKKLAEDKQAQVWRDKRAGEATFADKSRGAVSFVTSAEDWIERHKNAGTRATLRTTLKRITPDIGARTLAQVANDRELVQSIIDDAPGTYAKKTRLVIVSPVNEALKCGRIPSHRLRGLDVDEENARAKFEWADHDQLKTLARELGEFGMLVWLGRLAGLRVGESMGVHIDDFREGGTVLRLQRQRLADATLAPLKARKTDDFRDPGKPSAVGASPVCTQGCRRLPVPRVHPCPGSVAPLHSGFASTGGADFAPLNRRVNPGLRSVQGAKGILLHFILFSHDSFHNIRAGIILACISDAEYDIHKFIPTQSR